MKVVIRVPRADYEQPIPVGVVSNSYTLAQHHDVINQCFSGIRHAGVNTENLICELGITELAEWINFRIHFPDSFRHQPADGKPVGLRLECFNSVDGSSRLVILLGWIRFICSNGMIIGETKTEFRDVHNKNLDLEKIPEAIEEGLGFVRKDLERLNRWERESVSQQAIEEWVNGKVSESWGKKAACRVLHICLVGRDVEITDPFAKGEATDKPIRYTEDVPGAVRSAKSLYDVSQALSWVASKRSDAEERLVWQAAIPQLIRSLAAVLPGQRALF